MLHCSTMLNSLLDNPIILLLAVLLFNSITNIVTSVLAIVLSKHKVDPTTLKEFKQILESAKIELIK